MSCEIINIDIPFSDNSNKDLRIKDSDPTSIPQVGWDKINKSGFERISLPMINFWRLPPDNSPALDMDEGALTLNSLIIFFV